LVQSPYPEFRKRLDAVLNQRDPAALRDFLVAEGQWDANTATDPERAMWMMIATSPSLASMHAEAIAWLNQRGYKEEAQALGRRSGDAEPRARQSKSSGGQRRRPSGPQHHRRQP
jgi:hypothetical protein